MHTPDPDLAALRVRGRIAISAFFALGGFVFAGWAVRIPAMATRIDAAPGVLGSALLGLSAATLIAMLAAGPLCRRFGSARVAIVTGSVLPVSVVVPTLARSATELGLGLIVFGSAFGANDIAVNSAAVDLAAMFERPIMSRLHAANSLGSLAGAGVGGLVGATLSPTRHLALLAPAGIVAALVAGRALISSPIPHIHESHDEAPRSRTLIITTIFGVIALCSAFTQGGADNWMPMHLSRDLGASSGLAACGYAVMQGAIAVGRLSGAALVVRLGPTRVLVWSGATACAGTVLAALTPWVWLALPGLCLLGLGLANTYPLAMSIAGRYGGPNGISVATILGYCGLLLAPPAIGIFADITGLSRALLMTTGVISVATLLAYTVHRRGIRR